MIDHCIVTPEQVVRRGSRAVRFRAYFGDAFSASPQLAGVGDIRTCFVKETRRLRRLGIVCGRKGLTCLDMTAPVKVHTVMIHLVPQAFFVRILVLTPLLSLHWAQN